MTTAKDSAPVSGVHAALRRGPDAGTRDRLAILLAPQPGLLLTVQVTGWPPQQRPASS